MDGSSNPKKKAIVQGEFHQSDKDKNELLNRDLEDWDTLLVEGRDPVFNLKDSKFGFGYYAIGAISVRTIIRCLNKFLELMGVLSGDAFDELDIDVNNRIDAQHRDIWAFTNRYTRWILLLFAALASIGLLYRPGFLGNISELFSIWHSLLVFFPFLPGFVHIFAVVNPTNSSERNEKMVESIVEYTSENGYDRALILVGEMHRTGVSNSLEDRGWDVASNPTNSWAGRKLSSIYRKFGDWR
ncbi:MAG: hypothetical protein ABEI86_01420 [Halobacteriaceae archaeon]